MEPQRLKDLIVQSKWRLYVVSIGYTLVMAPQFNLFSLQSSIGVKDGLGASSVVVFGIFGFAALLVYNPLMALIGRKNCLVYGSMPSVLLTLSYFYPRFWTVTTSGILVGIADSIITPACGVIIMSLAPAWNESSDQVERRHSRMGIFLAIRGLGQAIISVVPSAILKDSRVYANTTAYQTRNISNCGAEDCPKKYAFLQTSSMFDRLIPTTYSLRVYLSVFCAAQIVGVLMHIVAIPREGKSSREERQNILSSDEHQKAETDFKSSFFKVVYHMKEKYRLLTIPIQVQHGLFMSFIWSEIGRAYVSCAIGVGNLGYFTAVLFASHFLTNLIWNRFSSSGSLPALYIVAFVLETTTYLVSLFWRLSNDLIYLKLYLFAVLLGIAYNFQRIAAYSVTIYYFKDLDSAYLVQVGVRGLGNALVFCVTTSLCVFVKVYILMSLAAFSTVLILIAHYLFTKDRKAEAKL